MATFRNQYKTKGRLIGVTGAVDPANKYTNKNIIKQAYAAFALI